MKHIFFRADSGFFNGNLFDLLEENGHEYLVKAKLTNTLNLKGLTGTKIHSLYGGRAESENWIENTKNQLYAGQTITDDFYVNDILWQLSVMAYNISVLMRYESDYKVWKQEPKTFREWFILVPGKVVTNARKVTVKMSVHYLYAIEWGRLADKIPIAA